MERVLPASLSHVFVGADTGCLERFRRKLLVFVGDEMGAEGEVVDGGALAA